MTTPTIEDKFRTSLVKRAKKRLVIAAGDRRWVVRGEPSLGDAYPRYSVTLDHGSRVYMCSCYFNDYGSHRRHKVCSHVLAVILYRQVHRTSSGRGVNDDGAAPHEPQPELSAVSAPLTHLDTPPIPSRDDPMWGDPPLPAFIQSIHPHQWQAVQEIVASFKDGKRIMWLDAPTGSGKTLIAELVRRLMGLRNAAYVCSSKSLQDQFIADYPYAMLLKGRSNYPTTDWPYPAYSAADCDSSPGIPDSCSWCSYTAACPYGVAKTRALDAPLSVLNTAYFMAEANYVGGMSGRELVIVDECDVLEQTVMGFVEFSMTDRLLKTLALTPPVKGAHKPTIVTWIEEEAIPAVRRAIVQAKQRVQLDGSRDVADVRQEKTYAQVLMSLGVLATQLPGDNWVRDYNSGPFCFKPIRVDTFAPTKLWGHGIKWLCMSATIISPDTLAESLGVPREDWGMVRAPMTFPVANRRIIVAPIANMAHKQSETSRPKLAHALGRIMDMHPSERILVHTVSYDLTKYLARHLRSEPTGDRVMSYTGASERDGTLARFRKTAGAVLLAPSLDRGIDLRDDDCRVVVVAKVPFPSLGDSQIGARLHSPGGQEWYAVQTIRTLVQMTGRGVRNKDDWCLTYILDSQFQSNVWKKSKGLLPKWWTEAVDKSFPVRKLMA